MTCMCGSNVGRFDGRESARIEGKFRSPLTTFAGAD
jgi:hypothetical protein